MRALALSLVLVAFVPPAFGARRVTVNQLEQTIAAAHSLPDAKVAKQLSDIQLTERLSTAKLNLLEKDLPGKKSRQALLILADKSAFLDPPAAEIPQQPRPDLATQRKILALTVNYVAQTLQKLPNFFATRVTQSFQNKPAEQALGMADSAARPIHLVGDSHVTVTFRNGREVVEKSSLNRRARSLTTAGVFGPILGTVLVDAVRSKLAWSHWEHGPNGLEAVFSYEVPKKNSHYTISYDSIPNRPNYCTTVPQTYRKLVAYHGEMAIDPASGTILRLTLLADIKPDQFTVNSDIEVEYGQIGIGGKPYFLPVRSVTYSLAHSLLASGAWGHGAGCPTLAETTGLQTSLNDVVFKHYHVFRADATVLTDSEAAKRESQPSTPPIGNGSKQTEATSTSPPTAATSAKPSPPQNTQTAPSESSAANLATPLPQASQPAPQPAQSIAKSAQPPPPATPPASNQPPQPAPTNSANPGIPNTPILRTTARQVLVDVVVDKRNGKPVPGLSKSDFSIEEDGKPQTIDFFEEHSADVPTAAATPAMPPLPASDVTNVPAAPQSGALYVLLLDSLNTEPKDQVFVRKQVLSFLHKMDPHIEIAVFSLGSHLRLLQGFTSDSAALLAAVSRTQARRDAMAQTRSDNADDAHHIATLRAMRASGAKIAALQSGMNNTRSYSYGARASMTFEALNALARYLQGIPGRKNLVWFAGSFPVMFFPTSAQLAKLQSNPNIPGYVNKVKMTANLFTLSKIAVYPVSGEGVMNSNIGLADSAGAGSAGGTGHFGAAASPTSSLTREALGFASSNAGMEQLAASTGGRAFTTNDIGNALHKIVHDGAIYYTVGYAPTNAAGGHSFRRIHVKVTGGRYKLEYRRGYVADSGSTKSAPSQDPIAPLLRFGLPNATGIFYGARVAPTLAHSASGQRTPAGQNPQLKGPLVHYSVFFTIRAQDISFSQAPNGKRSATVILGVKAYGAGGAALNWQATRETAILTPQQYAYILKNGFPLTLRLDLPANAHGQLVTAVYDWDTGRAGTLDIPLQP